MPSIYAAILHDVVEDTNTSVEEIESLYGADVAQLVDGLTKISKIQFRSNQEKLAENFRKMVLAMAKDLRVIIVKLADRLHNMRTLDSLPVHKRVSIAQETMDIYAPLANRLGIYGIKSELEDLCLKQLKNDVYKEISKAVSTKKSERTNYIDEVKNIVKTELDKYGFKDAKVFGRPKHFYSIYKKMVERKLTFEDIHDMFAFRIIVKSVKDCYEALGVVHAMWKPMPGRFKDYIAMPKANMYQSLHTTVIRPNGEPAEFQIRTEEMHSICEFGVAAHWAYKEKGEKSETDLKKFSWLRQIMQWESELSDPLEFMESVKIDLFDDEIFVFTPRGDVIQLPNGATPLDFAFSVHTELGVKTVGAKINGRMCPLRKKLNSGDIVEIQTSSHQKPSKDWLAFVITSKAKTKIRQYLRGEQRETSKTLGKDLLVHALEQVDVTWDKFVKTGKPEVLNRLCKEAKLDDSLAAIGYGHMDAKDLVQKIYPSVEGPAKIPNILRDTLGETAEQYPSPIKKRSSQTGVLVGNMDNVLVSMARCCSPVPGDDIIGFITRGKGVTIHLSTCQSSLDLDPARRIDVSWRLGEQTLSHLVCIRIETQDRQGILADVTTAIASTGANIQKANINISKDLLGVLDFELLVKNIDHLRNTVNRIESLTGVISVNRVNLDQTPQPSSKRTKRSGRLEK
jgi:GTP pyrophosphokinase